MNSFELFLCRDFEFRAERYEEYCAGKMISQGPTNIIVVTKTNINARQDAMQVKLMSNNIPEKIKSQFSFDFCTTLNDRVLMASLPEKTNTRIVTTEMLRHLMSPSQYEKYYTPIEPVVASVFVKDNSLSKISFTMGNPERLIEFYPLQVSDSFLLEMLKGSNNPPMGELKFSSNTHQRYEKSNPVKGEQRNCHRDIIITRNISGNIGYSVKIMNADAPNSFFGVTMSTKPMKVVESSNGIVHMRGYGYDNNAVAMGISPREASFEDYGLSIYHNGNEIVKCVLHMFDRNVDIEYYNR